MGEVELNHLDMANFMHSGDKKIIDLYLEHACRLGAGFGFNDKACSQDVWHTFESQYSDIWD